MSDTRALTSVDQAFALRILKGVWKATIGILADIGAAHLMKPSHWQAYRHTALCLKEYFHAAGDGLTGEDLDNSELRVSSAVTTCIITMSIIWLYDLLEKKDCVQ